MTSPIRVRRHPDGRVAIQRPSGDYWHVCDMDPRWPAVSTVHDSELADDGWSELFVAELPGPDGETNAVDRSGEDVKTPLWRTSWGESVTAWIESVETPIWELQENLDQIRSDALKMLAAVAACERYRG